MARYFFDTEFIEDGKTIELISIGVVCEDGREFYAENANAVLSNANDWVKENVFPHLWSRSTDEVRATANKWSRDGGTGGLLYYSDIAKDLRRWINEGKDTPEFWAYYADYDWVALCQLYGAMVDLPEGWPMFCLDLKQWCYQLGDPRLPEQTSTEHHALADARWNFEVYKFLNNYHI